MKALKHWIIRTYSTTSTPQRLHGLAMLTFIAGQFLARKFGDLISNITTSLAMALIVSGFVIWCFPAARWLYGAWERPFAKTPIVLLHIFVLLLATVLARSMVADALALPPQSFDATVGFLVLMFYLPAWMLVAALVLALAGVIMIAIPLLLLPAQSVLQNLVILIRAFGGQVTMRRTRTSVLLHGLGAFIASVVLLKIYTYWSIHYQPQLYPLVRLIAFKSDFNAAPLYPGVEPGEMIHPLENGFAAFARIQADESILITVRAQENSAEQRQIGEPIPSSKQVMRKLIERLRPTLETVPIIEEPINDPSSS